MEEDLLSQCLVLEDMFLPLLIASEQSTPERALVTLVKTSETHAGRADAACKYAVVSALELCRNLSYASSSRLLSLTLELIRNLCHENKANQNLFLEQDGVGVVLSTLDGIPISVSNFAFISLVLQVLANVVGGGEVYQLDIWSRLFPNKFLELARVRKREICDPLCMLIYKCCDQSGKHFDELLADKDLSLTAELVRTASRVSPEDGIGKSPLKPLLSKICFEANKFPELFSKFFSSEITENGTPTYLSTTVFGEEQAFMLKLLSSAQLAEISIQSKAASAILEIVKQAAEAVELLPKDESSVPMKSATLDVLMFSLMMLRDICANKNESMNSVIDFVLSLGLIELMLSLLSDLEPPEIIKWAMKQKEDDEEEETIFLPSKPCPYKGFRTHVVSVIAYCASEREYVRDEVRERKGIPLLLQHCVTDKDNEFLREWGIWAMRNILVENVENQKIVAQLEVRGTVDLPEIADIGRRVKLSKLNHRPYLVKNWVEKGSVFE